MNNNFGGLFRSNQKHKKELKDFEEKTIEKMFVSKIVQLSFKMHGRKNKKKRKNLKQC